MNREIKFRGISVDTGEWVYGSMVRGVGELVDRVYVVPAIITGYYSVYSMMDCIEVDPSTVGQYTGLKDKNGVEIYEGDIVAKEQVYHFIDREGWEPEKNGKWIIIGEKVKNFTGKKEEKYVAGYCNIMVIEWNVKSAGYEPFSDSMENCGHCGGGDNPADYMVLGNIHQNPELLNS